MVLFAQVHGPSSLTYWSRYLDAPRYSAVSLTVGVNLHICRQINPFSASLCCYIRLVLLVYFVCYELFILLKSTIFLV